MISSIMQDYVDCEDSEESEDRWLIAIARACLNRSNLNELGRYRRELLTPMQGALLKIVREKIDSQPHLFGRDRQDYDKIVGLVLMSTWDRTIDFCTCMDMQSRYRFGIMRKKLGKLNCGLWRFCPHCAWRKEMDLQGRFLTVFEAGHWCCLTASFTGNLPMHSMYLNRQHPTISHADLNTYYESIRFAVKSMKNEGIFLGAVLNEEIHLESLYPLPLVTPHAHIIVLSADPITQAHLDHFKNLMLQFQGRTWDLMSSTADDPCWDAFDRKMPIFEMGLTKSKPRMPSILKKPDPRLKVEMPVSLDLKPLQTQEEFSALLGYPAKPIALQSVYMKERKIILRENPQDLELLAQNVDEFILGCDLLFTPLKSPVYFGACDARCRRKTPYIGASAELVADKDHRDETKELLMKLNAKAKDADAV